MKIRCAGAQNPQHCGRPTTLYPKACGWSDASRMHPHLTLPQPLLAHEAQAVLLDKASNRSICESIS